MRNFKVLACVLSALLLSACLAPEPIAGSGVITSRNDALAQAALKRVNALRARNGETALRYSPDLAAIAQAHADDMARRGVMSHKGADGSRVSDRADRAGYAWCRIAENVAAGQTDLSQAMQDWVASPGHKRNLLKSDLEEFGIGRAGLYWAMVFARPGC